MKGAGPLRRVFTGFLVLLGAVALVAAVVTLSQKAARQTGGETAAPTSLLPVPTMPATTMPATTGPGTTHGARTGEPAVTAPAGSPGAAMPTTQPGSGPTTSGPTTSRTGTAPAGSSATPGTRFMPVPPLTDTPAQTPVQEQFDAALSSGLSSSTGLQAAEAMPIPGPAFSAGRGPLGQSNTPQQWVQEFVPALLGIDFAHQSRPSLEKWVSAETAPELLPGVPTDVQDKVLYLSLFDTAVVGGPSPIPDQATWNTDARMGVRWSVSGLTVQTDPQYSQILAAGWEPLDQRFTVEDVSGILTVSGHSASGHGATGSGATGHGASGNGATTTRHFSMAVYLGSAHWHQGYGTVLVDNWKEG